jgi:hypothetical protein
MDENCGICQSPFGKGKTKIIHKNEKTWEHKFHSACIDRWILTCKNSDKTPNCPLCPDFEIPVNKIPKKMRNIGLEDEPQVMPQVMPQVVGNMPQVLLDNAEDGFGGVPDEYRSEIVARERHAQIMEDPSELCMGFIVIVGGKRLLHCLNPCSGIGLDWTLQEVKDYVLQLNKRVYDVMGKFTKKNIIHNLSLSNWVQWKYPELQITDVHYGIPSQNHRFDKFDIELDNEKTVDQMYIEYQTRLRENIKRGNLTYEVREKMRNIYYEEELWHYGSTGPDDPGRADYGFHNPDNPYIPELYRSDHLMSERMKIQSTKYSLMWLVFHTEYV